MGVSVDLTLRKFEGIEVLKKSDYRDSNRNTHWFIQCKVCFKTKEVATSNLVRRSNIKSCGCLNGNTLPKGESGKRELLKSYKHGALKRDLEFSLSDDEFYNLVSNPCHYCGLTDSITTKRGKTKELQRHTAFKSNGVDRVDNTKGYTSENCVSCCKFCNVAKHARTRDEFIEWINRAYAHLNKESNNA